MINVNRLVSIHTSFSMFARLIINTTRFQSSVTFVYRSEVEFIFCISIGFYKISTLLRKFSLFTRLKPNNVTTFVFDISKVVQSSQVSFQTHRVLLVDFVPLQVQEASISLILHQLQVAIPVPLSLLSEA